MRLLLLALMAWVIGASTTYVHAGAAQNTAVYRVLYPDSLSPDSLQMLYRQIDMLSVFDLQKVRESYVYRNRMQPSNQNRQILLYIEERLKLAR